MQNETKEIKKLNQRFKLLIILIIIVFLQSVIKNVINEQWAKERDTVACIPEIETNYPGIYLQSAAHPINHDAKLQSFIAEYVRLTKNEELIDFHKLVDETAAGTSRYDKARLSTSKWKAIFMSKGVERALNKKRYAESSDVYKKLEQDKKSIVFLIDELLTFPVPNSLYTTVIVRGQYEALLDNAEQKNQLLPPEFLGYRELRYVIETSFPRVKVDDTWENKPGFYVIWSSEKILDPGQKLLLSKKSRELNVQR